MIRIPYPTFSKYSGSIPFKQVCADMYYYFQHICVCMCVYFLLQGEDASLKWSNSMVYAAVSIMQTFIAVLISMGGNAAVDFIESGSNIGW
jgi:hypothetical protein